MASSKIFIPILLLAFVFSAQLQSAATAVYPANEAVSAHAAVEKLFPGDKALTPKQLRKKAKLEKVITKLNQRIAKINAKRAKKGKSGIDFSDPVNKWMWFWIFAWGGALLLTIIASAVATGGVFTGGFGFAYLLALLGYLLWLGGAVCLVIWLIKMFG